MGLAKFWQLTVADVYYVNYDVCKVDFEKHVIFA